MMAKEGRALTRILPTTNWLPGAMARVPTQRGNRGLAGHARLRRVLERLGHPEQCYEVVHIAGTNGKGSTAAFLEACLRAAGRRVGLFTSPHLVQAEERIQIDRHPISLVDLDRLLPAVEAALAPEPEPPTEFELWTVVALHHFACQEADVVVLETGLGGRFDATNALARPTLTCITTVGLDHLDRLGPDLASVAWHKAGILKAGTPAVVGNLAPPALAVVEAEAARKGVPLRRLGIDFSCKASCRDGTWHAELPEPLGWCRLSLAGSHQAENAALAAELAASLGAPPAAIRHGLAHTDWPGRLQLLEGGRILLDGAHNPQATAALAATLTAWFPGERFTVIFGTLDGHDPVATFAPIGPLADHVYVVAADPVRGIPPAELARRLPAAEVLPLDRALVAARASAKRALVTGSLYLVGEVLKRKTR
jgi:dihydrofolate synthase/folylpolyglutamate synthase